MVLSMCFRHFASLTHTFTNKVNSDALGLTPALTFSVGRHRNQVTSHTITFLNLGLYMTSLVQAQLLKIYDIAQYALFISREEQF